MTTTDASGVTLQLEETVNTPSGLYPQGLALEGFTFGGVVSLEESFSGTIVFHPQMSLRDQNKDFQWTSTWRFQIMFEVLFQLIVMSSRSSAVSQ